MAATTPIPYIPGATSAEDAIEDVEDHVAKRKRVESVSRSCVEPAAPTAAAIDSRPLCRFFAQGFCAYGINCNFRHTSTSSSAVDNAPNSTHQMPLCTFFAQGRCTRGSACLFRHTTTGGAKTNTPEPASMPQDDTPCTYYARGHCNRGTLCRFRHVGVVKDQPITTTLQLIDDDTDVAKEDEKQKPRSAVDILKKYSASRRALAAGLDVKIKGKNNKATGVQSQKPFPNKDFSTSSAGQQVHKTMVKITELSPESDGKEEAESKTKEQEQEQPQDNVIREDTTGLCIDIGTSSPSMEHDTNDSDAKQEHVQDKVFATKAELGMDGSTDEDIVISPDGEEPHIEIGDEEGDLPDQGDDAGDSLATDDPYM